MTEPAPDPEPLTPSEIDQLRQMMKGELAHIDLAAMIEQPELARELLEVEADHDWRSAHLDEAFPNRMTVGTDEIFGDDYNNPT